MKKEFRKHLQKFCDISNWTRMHKPRNGKKNCGFRQSNMFKDIITD